MQFVLAQAARAEPNPHDEFRARASRCAEAAGIVESVFSAQNFLFLYFEIYLKAI